MSTNAVIRVLVVDDDARVRRALQELIDASEGLQVVANVAGASDALVAGAKRFVEKAPDTKRLLTALRHSARGTSRPMTSRGHVVFPMYRLARSETMPPSKSRPPRRSPCLL
jgi:hypothetical protein